MVSALKDPDKVRAGTIGARKRWGETPRAVRLADLEPAERDIITALLRLRAAREKAAGSFATSPAAESEVSHGRSAPR